MLSEGLRTEVRTKSKQHSRTKESAGVKGDSKPERSADASLMRLETPVWKLWRNPKQNVCKKRDVTSCCGENESLETTKSLQKEDLRGRRWQTASFAACFGFRGGGSRCNTWRRAE